MIAAPFLGEFGWQVALWVPWLRWMRRDIYPQHKDFIVVCKPGHEGLYEDFATEVVPHRVDRVTRLDCQLAWIDGVQVGKPAYEAICRKALEIPRNRIGGIICPQDMKHTWPPNRPPLPVKSQAAYHKYGSGERNNHFIALHARHCPDKQSDRDWPEANWEELVDWLNAFDLRICSVGSKAGALHIMGTEDMRGISIKEEVEILSACKHIIGPSSGPLHLANHCGTPAIWWACGDKNIERYDTAWNPFRVANKCVSSADWRPTVEQVQACLTS